MRAIVFWAGLVWLCCGVAAARAEDECPGEPDGCAGCRSLSDACANCDDCAECCDSFNGRRRLFGLFLPSDHCFDRFISPISNPFFFEDCAIAHRIPGHLHRQYFAELSRHTEANAWTAQFRGRVTDRFSVIAPRLSYLSIDNSGGFLSAPVGGKFNVVRDVENQFLVSVGMTYFIPGSRSVLSNFGNGDFHLFLTAGKQIFDRGHWLSGTGFRLPEDRNMGTQMWYWSNQWDYELPGHIYPLIGLNWFHYIDSGGAFVSPLLTGLDLINLPTNGIAGRNFVTNVIGARWKPTGHLEMGVGWEYPLTQSGDFLKNRIYADVIIRY